MEPQAISSRTVLADLLAACPQAAPVFLELRLDCLGCSMNKFCTIADLCRHYQLSPGFVTGLLEARMNEPPGNGKPGTGPARPRNSSAGAQAGTIYEIC